MNGDLYASVKELTAPRSAGRVVNKHAVSANRKIEPDYEHMRRLSHPHNGDTRGQA